MRQHGIKKLVYASGSGVYGDRGLTYFSETYGPLQPVSMYGASKMGAEGLVSAFVHLYDMQAWILRPANIIGPRATHGVVFDFIKRLQKDGTQLHILGDGKQSKAYLHVDDVIDAFLLVQEKGKEQLNFFNLSSSSFITVNEIADAVIAGMGLKKVKRTHTAGKIGWKGDVPVIRLHNKQIAKIGWKSHYTSAQAVKATIASLLKDPRFTKNPERLEASHVPRDKRSGQARSRREAAQLVRHRWRRVHRQPCGRSAGVGRADRDGVRQLEFARPISTSPATRARGRSSSSRRTW